MAFAFAIFLGSIASVSLTVVGVMLKQLAESSPAAIYLQEELVSKKDVIVAFNKAQREALAQLSTVDQTLVFLDNKSTHRARVAHRRYWKVAKPEAYAALYKGMGNSLEQAEAYAKNREEMPGYFWKKVEALMQG